MYIYILILSLVNNFLFTRGSVCHDKINLISWEHSPFPSIRIYPGVGTLNICLSLPSGYIQGWACLTKNWEHSPVPPIRINTGVGMLNKISWEYSPFHSIRIDSGVGRAFKNKLRTFNFPFH